MPSPAGFLAENTQRGMSTHPEEIHEMIHQHGVKGIFATTIANIYLDWGDCLDEYEHLLGPQSLHINSHQLPQVNSATRRNGGEVHMG